MTTQKLPLLTCFLSLFFILSFARPALAQDERDAPMREHEEEQVREPKHQSEFMSHLWFGGGIGLNYYSYYDPNVNLNGSVFLIGVSPMVGYKLNRVISVGPRVAFNFYSVKYQGYKAVGLFDIDAGFFVRARIFRGLFAQGELSNEWIQQPYQLDPIDRKITKLSSQRFNQRLGLGYNFSNGEGGGGSEIAVLYNLAIANDDQSFEQPYEIRFAITFGY